MEHKTNDWVRSKINFTVGAHGDLFWHLSGDGRSRGSGVSRAPAASLKPSFMAPLEDEQRRGRQKLDGQRQRVGISAHAKTAHDGLLKERLEEDPC